MLFYNVYYFHYFIEFFWFVVSSSFWNSQTLGQFFEPLYVNVGSRLGNFYKVNFIMWWVQNLLTGFFYKSISTWHDELSTPSPLFWESLYLLTCCRDSIMLPHIIQCHNRLNSNIRLTLSSSCLMHMTHLGALADWSGRGRDLQVQSGGQVTWFFLLGA